MAQACRAAILAGAALLSAAAHADTVKLAGRPPFQNVAVTDFRGGRVAFRGVSGEYIRKSIGEVEWVCLAGQPDINAAEGFAAAADWPRAVTGYERALAQPNRPWLASLIRTRLLCAADRAGQFDRAVTVLVELVAAGAAPPAASIPRHPGLPGSEMNRRTLAALEEALPGVASSADARVLRLLLLELALYEDVELPAALRSEAAAASQPAATSRPSTAPAGPLGILPAEDARPSATSRPSAAARLRDDSFLLDAIAAALDRGDHAWAESLLERALPFVEPTACYPWRLLLGRCQIEGGRFATAAAGLMDVAAHDPDPARRAWALYYVGLAHERMDRVDVARDLYQELAERADAPDDVRASAQGGLRRLPPQP
jgi:tetratricopeptide (TPR) repeat protein